MKSVIQATLLGLTISTIAFQAHALIGEPSEVQIDEYLESENLTQSSSDNLKLTVNTEPILRKMKGTKAIDSEPILKRKRGTKAINTEPVPAPKTGKARKKSDRIFGLMPSG